MGSIATLTGAIASNFNGTPAGMQAYFDYINSQGWHQRPQVPAQVQP